jgi:hypothetical protein
MLKNSAKARRKTMLKKIWLRTLLIVLVFGMTVFGCKDKPDDENGYGNNSSGTFTLTSIPSNYENKYAYLIGGNSNLLIISPFPTLISNRKVVLGLIAYDGSTSDKYSGNDTVDVEIAISNTSDNTEIIGYILYESITFKNGNATRSWNDYDDLYFY